MITACPTGITGASLARDALAGVDCVIGGQVESGYAALLAPGGAFAEALTLALTIYVAIVGYRLILGQAGLTLGELVPHFVKLGLVLALVTNWPAYQSLVFDVLFHGPEQLADSLTGRAPGLGTAHGGILDGLQILFDRLTDYAGNAWSQHSATTTATTATPAAPVTPAAPIPPPGATIPGATIPGAAAASPAAPAALPFTLGAPQFVAALLWLAAAVMMAASVGVLLVVRIVLALLLLIGPVFVAMALFAPSRGLALGWLRTTLKFALVPLFTLPLTAAMLAVAGPLAADLGTAPIVSVRDGPALFIVLVIFVFAAVMWQAARLGGGIASGLRFPRFVPTAAASPGVATAGSSAATTNVAVAGSSRADQIVQSIGTGRYGTAGSAGTAGIAAARALTVGGVAVAAGGPVAAAGLGQSYRRLAVASAPRRLPS